MGTTAEMFAETAVPAGTCDPGETEGVFCTDDPRRLRLRQGTAAELQGQGPHAEPPGNRNMFTASRRGGKDYKKTRKHKVLPEEY